MEDSEYLNTLGCSHKIWNPIVAVEYFSNLSVSDWLVPMSDLRLSTQHLCLVKNSVNHLFAAVGLSVAMYALICSRHSTAC